MKLSAPSKIVFIISLVLLVLALLVSFGVLPIPVPAFWVAIASWVVLAIGCLMTGV